MASSSQKAAPRPNGKGIKTLHGPNCLDEKEIDSVFTTFDAECQGCMSLSIVLCRIVSVRVVRNGAFLQLENVMRLLERGTRWQV